MINGIFSSLQTIANMAYYRLSSSDKLGRDLHLAASAGRTHEVQALLEHANHRISDHHINQAFMLSARHGYHAIIRELLNHVGNRVSAGCKSNALKLASRNGHLDCVQELLNRVSHQISSEDKGAALVAATISGHLNCLQELLNRVGPEISTDEKGGALICAAAYDHLLCVQELLNRVAHEISVEDKVKALGFTNHNNGPAIIQEILRSISAQEAAEAMWLAAQKDLLNVAQQISNLCGVEFSAHIKGSALIAVSADKPDIYLLGATNSDDRIQALLALGDEIPSDYKNEALWVAATYDNDLGIRELLTHAAVDISAEAKGETLVHASAFGAFVSVRTLLTHCKADISTEHKYQALMWAASNGSLRILQDLLELDDISNSHIGIALCIAASHCQEIAVIRLLDHPICAQDKGEALHIATAENHWGIVDTLLEFGEITPDYKGEALILAARKRHYHSFKTILAYGQDIASEDKIAALAIIIRALVRSRCQVVTNTYRAMLGELQTSIIVDPLPDAHQAVALKVISEVSNPALLNQYKRAQPSERVESDEANDAEVHQDKRARKSK